MRGGAFNNNDNNLRCAYRNNNDTTNRNNNIGFRVVASHIIDEGYEEACQKFGGITVLPTRSFDGAVIVLAMPRGMGKYTSAPPLERKHPRRGNLEIGMNKIVIHDLERVIAYRQHLVRFNQELEDAFRSMNEHSREIRDTWDDEQYWRFIADFEEAMRGVQQYLSHREAHEGYLARLIERAKAVLETDI